MSSEPVETSAAEAAALSDRRLTEIRDLPRRIRRASWTAAADAADAIRDLAAEVDRLRAVERALLVEREQLVATAADHAELTQARYSRRSHCPECVNSISMSAFAEKVAQKRAALGHLAEACREVDRLRAELVAATIRDAGTYRIGTDGDTLDGDSWPYAMCTRCLNDIWNGRDAEGQGLDVATLLSLIAAHHCEATDG